MLRSPPSWRRGLKSNLSNAFCAVEGRLLRGGVDWNFQKPISNQQVHVASFVEAWIEIVYFFDFFCHTFVASFVEAWIEILFPRFIIIQNRSPPSWRRGLKSVYSRGMLDPYRVASFVEAWIEIPYESAYMYSRCGRLLRGGVDWNTAKERKAMKENVASFVEAWIEIFWQLYINT